MRLSFQIVYSDPLPTWKSNSLKSRDRIQSQGHVSPIWQSVYMSHNLERSQSFTLRAFFRCDTMSTRRIVIFLVLQGMGYTLCGRKQLVFMTIDQIFGDNLISSSCLSTELLGGLRGQAASAQEASIHPDLPSAHFTPKSCHLIGRARSRWQMLASDWSRLALLGCRGQCGNFRKWKHPNSTADLNSWAATERGRVGKAFRCTATRKTFQLHRECRGRTLLFAITSKHSSPWFIIIGLRLDLFSLVFILRALSFFFWAALEL